MRVISFVMVVVASIFMFAACCSDELATSDTDDGGVQSIVVQVVSAGDRLVTRAGRPLYSSEAAQDIDHIKLVVYNPTTKVIVFEEYLDNWKTISKEFTDVGHGMQYTMVLKGGDKLAAGTYKVLAVGHAVGSEYDYEPLLTDLIKEGDYTVDNIVASVTDEAEEVFAGEMDLTVTAADDQAFVAPVTLHRQVAGAFGYFKNLPAVIDGVKAKTLRLVSVGKNADVEFKDFHSEFAEIGSTDAVHIVNGASPVAAAAGVLFSDNVTTGHVVYSIDLATYFPNGDVNNDNILGEADNWVNPNTNLNIMSGSVFAGKFIVPFALSSGKNTMEVQLLGEDDSIIKHWTVRIPQGDLASGKTAPQVNDESVYAYNIVRNHMYNIGTKTTNVLNPAPGDEEAEDLSKDQDIVLKVNDNWELIHSMELE